MSRKTLSFAAVDYDRFAPIKDGRVTAEGIDFNFLDLPVEETFYRQVSFREFDVSEMSLSSYLLTLEFDDPPFVAIPAFPSRYFRHQALFINADGPVVDPSDLVGRTIGVPEYQLTACVWMRGILSDEFGVRADSVRWRTGGLNSPGRTEKIPLDLPDTIDVTPISSESTLSDLLVTGEIDAILAPAVPDCFGTVPQVRRLFPDYKRVEQEYFTRTGIFPIMHVVAIRREVLEADRWIARSVLKALESARLLARQDLDYRSALKVMLPWLADHVEETTRIMGEDYWTYGLAGNEANLEAFVRYSHEQGLVKRQWRPEELFAPSTLSEFTI